jgi:hypothetical protein
VHGEVFPRTVGRDIDHPQVHAQVARGWARPGEEPGAAASGAGTTCRCAAPGQRRRCSIGLPGPRLRPRHVGLRVEQERSRRRGDRGRPTLSTGWHRILYNGLWLSGPVQVGPVIVCCRKARGAAPAHALGTRCSGGARPVCRGGR